MIVIDNEACIGCGLCVKDCLAQALTLTPEGKAQFNGDCIQCAHCVAICPNHAVEMTGYEQDPPQEIIPGEHTAPDPKQLMKWLRSRRSTRTFLPAPIEEDKLALILEAGRCAPTAANMQNVRYILVTEQLDQLRGLVLEALNRRAEELIQQGLRPMSKLNYLRMWPEMYAEYLENPSAPDRLTFGAPAVLLIVSPSDINGGLAAADMRLMADALGLGSLYSGFIQAATKQPQVAEFLGLKKNENVITSLVLGSPAVTYHRTAPRKPLKLTRL